MNKFALCVAFTFDEEKGYANVSNDPGGPTNMGIIQDTLDAARVKYPELGLPLYVKYLTKAQAREIYRLEYWNEIRGDELPLYLAQAVFDACVNTRMAKVVKWLQYTVGVTPDGNIGPKTIAAAKKVNPKKALEEFHARRSFNFMLQDDIDDTFGLGWGRRLIRIHNQCTSLAELGV